MIPTAGKQKTTTLGLIWCVVFVAALAVNFTHAPTAEAQEESYITDAAEAASCENVCNTFVPPQDEQECRDLASSRFHEEMDRHASTFGRLPTQRQAELDESQAMFEAEDDAFIAVRDERIALATAAFAVKVAGATAGLTACLAKAPAGPPGLAAAALCLASFHAIYASFLVALNSEIGDAWKDYHKDHRLAVYRAEKRDDAIKSHYDGRIDSEQSRHENTMGLINRDLSLCLERVNG